MGGGSAWMRSVNLEGCQQQQQPEWAERLRAADSDSPGSSDLVLSLDPFCIFY